MQIRPRILLPALAVSLAASGAAAQGPCTLEYRRADNMWANWGRADGDLGTETITLQPGQRKVFATDWSYEKRRNDGTNYYGSHLRRAVNAGAGPVELVVRGPGQLQLTPKGLTKFAVTALRSMLRGGYVDKLQPGYEGYFRHDLMEVACPEAAATTTTTAAPAAEPPPPTVLLSVIGTPATPTTTTLSVTVQAQDVATGAPLSGTVTINGITGTTGQPISFTRCTETVEYEDTRGVTRTRTVRVPCEGTVQISGRPETYFRF